MGVILVQLEDHHWTTEALQRALNMARKEGHEVVLLKMVHAQPHLLGTDYALSGVGSYIYNQKEIREYRTMAEGFGINLTAQPMTYITLPEALLEAADTLDAVATFATIPKMFFGTVQRMRAKKLQHLFRKAGRTLYMMEDQQFFGQVPQGDLGTQIEQ